MCDCQMVQCQFVLDRKITFVGKGIASDHHVGPGRNIALLCTKMLTRDKKRSVAVKWCNIRGGREEIILSSQ